MHRRVACLVILLLASVAYALPGHTSLTLPSGKVMQTEVMIQDADREMGLMYRPSLPEDHAMLFVFEQLDFHTFWMKNCKFAIDIVWLDETKRVVHVAEAVPPCRAEPCPTYKPMQRAAYVLELSSGQARREKVALGATLQFKLPE